MKTNKNSGGGGVYYHLIATGDLILSGIGWGLD